MYLRMGEYKDFFYKNLSSPPQRFPILSDLLTLQVFLRCIHFNIFISFFIFKSYENA